MIKISTSRLLLLAVVIGVTWILAVDADDHHSGTDPAIKDTANEYSFLKKIQDSTSNLKQLVQDFVTFAAKKPMQLVQGMYGQVKEKYSQMRNKNNPGKENENITEGEKTIDDAEEATTRSIEGEDGTLKGPVDATGAPEIQKDLRKTASSIVSSAGDAVKLGADAVVSTGNAAIESTKKLDDVKPKKGIFSTMFNYPSRIVQNLNPFRSKGKKEQETNEIDKISQEGNTQKEEDLQKKEEQEKEINELGKLSQEGNTQDKDNNGNKDTEITEEKKEEEAKAATSQIPGNSLN